MLNGRLRGSLGKRRKELRLSIVVSDSYKCTDVVSEPFNYRMLLVTKQFRK